MPRLDGGAADNLTNVGVNRRSLEDALASVLEGDGVLYAGDGMKLLVKPSTIEVARPKRRRRRAGRSRERAQMFTTAVRHPDEVAIPVSLSEEEILEEAESLGLRAESRTESDPQVPVVAPMDIGAVPQSLSFEEAIEILEALAESSESSKLEVESRIDPDVQAPAVASMSIGAVPQSLSDIVEAVESVQAPQSDDEAFTPEENIEDGVSFRISTPDLLEAVDSEPLDRRPTGPLDRVSFRVVPVPIRFAEHARSPFVVSLRGLALSAEPLTVEEYLPQSDILSYDLNAADNVPSLEILQSLARDLSVDEADGVRYSEQFTPSKFSSSYASAYGPFTKFFDRIGMYADRMVGVMRPRTSRSREVVKRAPSEGEAARSLLRAARGQDDRRLSRIETLDRLPAGLRDRWSAGPPVRVPVARTVVVMGALAFVAMLPANVVRLARTLEAKRADVTNAGTNAMGDLKGAAISDLSTSIDALRKASDGFRAADESLSNTNALAIALANVVPQARESYASARALLEVGAKTSDAGRLLAKGLDAALSGQGRGILDRLGVLSAYADGALPLLNDASRALATVDVNVIPEDERTKIDALREGLETGRLAVREFVGGSELLAQLLGRDAPKRFLVVFQNPNEIRPTGGFMGSYAELDLDRGAIQRLVIPGGGTYDLQGQLVKQMLPPEPLRLVANRWEFQDANWSPDFPTAAAKIREIWSASGGYTVDGIVAVNATVVADLIAITGPVDVPELGKTLTSENVVSEIEKSAEIEYDRAENKPKKILSLAGPRLLEKLKTLPPDGLVRALAVFSDAIERKEIQIALSNPDEDALAQGFDWSGRLKETYGDSLAVVNANIAGGKTDAVMSESISHAAVVSEDGSITDTVAIERTHHGVKRAPLTGVRNVEYIRIYVPRGSSLISAEGFATSPRALIEKPREDAVADDDLKAAELSQKKYLGAVEQWDEGNRTVIGGWSTVDPGETRTITVSYRLPVTAFDIQSRLSNGSADASNGGRAAYSLLLTSQSGVRGRTISSSISVPPSWTASWSRDLDTQTTAWDRDRVVSFLYGAARP